MYLIHWVSLQIGAPILIRSQLCVHFGEIDVIVDSGILFVGVSTLPVRHSPDTPFLTPRATKCASSRHYATDSSFLNCISNPCCSPAVNLPLICRVVWAKEQKVFDYTVEDLVTIFLLPFVNSNNEWG